MNIINTQLLGTHSVLTGAESGELFEADVCDAGSPHFLVGFIPSNSSARQCSVHGLL